MYREPADRDLDSGWRFMSGFESGEYMNDPDNHAVYDVNTIRITIQILCRSSTRPVGSTFERENAGQGRSRKSTTLSRRQNSGIAKRYNGQFDKLTARRPRVKAFLDYAQPVRTSAST